MREKVFLFAITAFLKLIPIVQGQDTIVVKLSRDSMREGLSCGALRLGKVDIRFCFTDLNGNGSNCERGDDGISIRNLNTGELSTLMQENPVKFLNEDSTLYKIEWTNCDQVTFYSVNAPASNDYDMSLRGRLMDMRFKNIISNDTINLFSYLSSIKYDYVFLSFWTPKMDIEELEYFDLFAKQSKIKLSTVHLCWDYEEDSAIPILLKVKPPGIYGVCTRAQMEFLNINFLPAGLLYDRHGALVKVFYGPNSLFNYLRNIGDHEK